MSAPENPWATTSGDGGGSQKLSKKFEKGLEKTKAVASKSYKQVKKGTSDWVNKLKILHRAQKLKPKDKEIKKKKKWFFI